MRSLVTLLRYSPPEITELSFWRSSLWSQRRSAWRKPTRRPGRVPEAPKRSDKKMKKKRSKATYMSKAQKDQTTSRSLHLASASTQPRWLLACRLVLHVWRRSGCVNRRTPWVFTAQWGLTAKHQTLFTRAHKVRRRSQSQVQKI